MNVKNKPGGFFLLRLAVDWLRGGTEPASLPLDLWNQQGPGSFPGTYWSWQPPGLAVARMRAPAVVRDSDSRGGLCPGTHPPWSWGVRGRGGPGPSRQVAGLGEPS